MRLDALHPQWPALSRLLDEALELAPDARSAWLATLAGSDAALRPTLAQLLQLHRDIETADFLRARPPLPRAAFRHDAPAGPMPALQPTIETGPTPGDSVGPYRLQRQLGRGGMGTVWLAERADGGLKRPVALKLPRLAWDEHIAARMARERDILAALDHPHIARLHDAGFDALGRPWLALELVEGLPIDRHAHEHGLDMRARVQLLLQAAQAVAYAHARQVVHRDLKPSNIQVGTDGRVRLLDFGIARLLHGGATHAVNSPITALTRIGDRALTVAYASPEQVRGDPAGPASDVWSLGVVAYELLAGMRPYQLDRGSAAELEEAIASAEIAPPSSRATDPALARALKGDLDAIVMRALQRDSAARTPSAEAMAADLQRHLAGEPVSARAERWHERAVRLLRRRRVALAIGVGVAAALALAVGVGPTALAFAALATGLVLASLQARQARRRAAEAIAQTQRADAVQQLLFSMLESAGIGAGSDEERRGLTIVAWLEQAAQQLRTAPVAEPAVHEALLQLVSRLQHGLGAHDDAASLREAWVQRLAARGAPVDEQARACLAWGESLAAADRPDAAAAAFEAGLAAAGGMTAGDIIAGRVAASAGPEPGPGPDPGSGSDPGADHATRPVLLAQLGLVHWRRGQADSAARLIETAAAAPPGEGRADVLGALAQLRGDQGRLDESYRLFDAAIAADDVAGDTLRPAALQRRHQFAGLLSARLQYTRAEATFRAALAAVEAAGGGDHPATVRLREDLCHLLTLLGRPDEAAHQLQRAVATVEARPAAFPALARPRLVLMQAQLLQEAGQIEVSGPLVVAATDALATVPGEEGCFARVARARWLADIGRYDEALQWLAEVLRRRIDAYGAGHAYVMATINRIAVALMHAGRFDEAQARFDEVLQAVPAETAGTPTFGSPQDMAATMQVQLNLERRRPEAAVEPARAALARLQSVPEGQRTMLNELLLRLRCARALLGCGRVDEAMPYLEPLEALTRPLHAHAPQRAAIEAARAEALLLRGDPAGAADHLARAQAHLAHQPSLGPHWRRYVDRVAARLHGA